MNYQQALDYIYSFVNFETNPIPRTAEHFDLRRMYELMAQLGNPQDAVKSVHITGTKGKGSTAAMIASVLATSGYNTGLYTSPHLLDLRERIQVNGDMIPEADLIALVEKLKSHIEAVNQQATYGKLTTFEVLTALAFAYFQQRGVDYMVLEVGLGGRLDATNIIKSPAVCVITSISYDHTDVLGDTLAKIAAEKAAIIKPGCVVVTSSQHDEVREVIEKRCEELEVRLVQVDKDVFYQSAGYGLGGQRLTVNGLFLTYELGLPLLGDHQMENAAVAVAALEALASKAFKISKDSIIEGITRVKWPGRFQILRKEPMVIADGAHNHDSAQKLAQTLVRYCGLSPEKGERTRKAVLVLGASMDKKVESIIAELYRLFDYAIVTVSHNPRAMAVSKLQEEFSKLGVETESAPDVKTALSRAIALAGDEGLVCVTGSLFAVAEALEYTGKPD